MYAQVLIVLLLLVGSIQRGFAMTEDEVKKNMLPPVRLQHRLGAFGGKLLGFDGGEWGGSLVFLDAAGKAHTLITENVQAIVHSRDGIFVFTGLAHLSMNMGAIHTVIQLPDGSLKAQLLVKLPGAPSNVQYREDGSSSFFVFTGSEPMYKCFNFSLNSVDEAHNCGERQQ